MTKRLQVLLQDPEYREVQRAARSRRMTIAQWVREALEMARRREPLTDTETKIAAVRAAAKHDFPTGDIGQMLAEIESGYHPEQLE
jgi:predicted 2-oxoglutarate/Fe(II)-dependent dioxygenase YbiX